MKKIDFASPVALRGLAGVVLKDVRGGARGSVIIVGAGDTPPGSHG